MWGILVCVLGEGQGIYFTMPFGVEIPLMLGFLDWIYVMNGQKTVLITAEYLGLGFLNG
ncbi:hypothetical protein K470DRAFT_256255 [Piedraia hortae CBS 480.64]|uniref:Uncharacterized protein n=1 Tax=Piedraia hortae CBS 480.64 TaxID=1314780 RepID=A0A6A7C3B1_9PEZI|nr:hypothetical protein K470DRAFT_256255 [Piedraia hortae CBS 480.64]